MTQGEVRGRQESAGRLGPAPLPVFATKLSIAEILANPDGFIHIRSRERDRENDFIQSKLTLRHPEILTLGGESRKEDNEETVNSHDQGQ